MPWKAGLAAAALKGPKSYPATSSRGSATDAVLPDTGGAQKCERDEYDVTTLVSGQAVSEVASVPGRRRSRATTFLAARRPARVTPRVDADGP
jgi:hypothetical protein